MRVEHPEQQKRTTDTLVSLLKAGNAEAAEVFFAKEREILSESFLSECLGHISYFDRELQRAVAHYENAIALNPDRVIARYQYLVGLGELRKGNHRAAFDRYQYAIESEPNLAEAYEAMGELMQKIGEHEAAKKCFTDAKIASER